MCLRLRRIEIVGTLTTRHRHTNTPFILYGLHKYRSVYVLEKSRYTGIKGRTFTRVNTGPYVYRSRCGEYVMGILRTHKNAKCGFILYSYAAV